MGICIGLYRTSEGQSFVQTAPPPTEIILASDKIILLAHWDTISGEKTLSKVRRKSANPFRVTARVAGGQTLELSEEEVEAKKPKVIRGSERRQQQEDDFIADFKESCEFDAPTFGPLHRRLSSE
jgi:hypothetical protein